MKYTNFRVAPNTKVNLKDYDTNFTADYTDKTIAGKDLELNVVRLAKLQDTLYAENTRALLVIFQALDASGKDSVVKHVFSGINPNGCHVVSFKAPSTEEREHDFLWRISKNLPERGKIGIFNRSHYEETLIVRVHNAILQGQQLSADIKNDKNIWSRRFEQIRNFENYLTENGIHILKFFLNVSKKEQKKRFLERIETPEKNWKFAAQDVKERGFWDDYMNAYEEVFKQTSTENAPWFIIPADNKWFTRIAVSEIICEKLESLNPQYPKLSAAQIAELQESKRLLENEGS